MPLGTSTDVEQVRDVQDENGEKQPPADGSAPQAIETGVAVDQQGTVVELDTRGKRNLDIGLKGAANPADYQLEASPDGSEWFGPYASWGGVKSITDGYLVGARHVRLVVSSPASNGTTVTAYLGVS
jgi:hypothetical protein